MDEFRVLRRKIAVAKDPPSYYDAFSNAIKQVDKP